MGVNEPKVGLNPMTGSEGLMGIVEPGMYGSLYGVVSVEYCRNANVVPGTHCNP